MTQQRIPLIHCMKCGECCKNFNKQKGVMIFPQDIKQLAQALKIQRNNFISTYCAPLIINKEFERLGVFQLKTIDHNCIFINENNLCTIYKSRPIQCKMSPFKFFWKNQNDFDYDCIKDVLVPQNWSSRIYDEELLNSLFKNHSK